MQLTFTFKEMAGGGTSALQAGYEQPVTDLCMQPKINSLQES